MASISMARLPTGRAGQVVAILILLLLLAAIWAAVASPLLDWHAERADAILRRATLAGRMAQVAADLPRLQQQSVATTRSGPVPVAVFEGASDAVAGAALQQKLQDMATQAGTSLSSIEALPPLQLGAYRRIEVRVAVNAPWPVLVRLLESIAQASPQMLVDDLQVHGSFGFIRDGAASLDASMAVMGFRAGTATP